VGVAVGVALLPQLSRAVGAGDRQGTRAALDQAVVFCMALTLPAAAALFSMPSFLIDGLYTRGAFTSVDAHATAMALQQYGWGVPAFVLAQLASRAYFAHQDTKTPMRYALVSVGVNIAAGVTLFHVVGVPGIAAATSLAAWVNVVMMLATLHKRGLYQPSARAWSKLARILAASIVLGAALALAAHFRGAVEHPFAAVRLGPLGAKEVAIVLVSLAGAASYPFLLFASGGLTLTEMKQALRRRRGAPPESPADLP
jgi:putative peptidoglycan lipid II flippase